MNDVKRCSISGIAFTLEVDAWEELTRYLEELRNQYAKNPDGEEILDDIEARIAELILSTQDNNRTVALPLIKNIIAQLGSAAEIGAESSEEEPEASKKESNAPKGPRIPRRLYRDAERGKLGGVCAGLGNYFDIDPVWVRFLLFLPLILNLILPSWWLHGDLNSFTQNLFGFLVLSYLVMWFAVPSARSARQKLEMKGEKITTESIRKTTAARSDVDGRSKAVVADTVSTFGQIILILLKLFAGLILMGLVVAACGLIIGAIAVVVTPDIARELADFGGLWLPLLAILMVLVPILLIIYILFCLIASRQPNGKTILATSLGWVVIVILLLTLAIRGDTLHKLENRWHYSLPSPSYNINNLLNDEPATHQEALENHEKALKAHEEALEKHKSALKSHQKAAGKATGTGNGIQVSTHEAEIDLKVNEKGLHIDVTDKESGETERVTIGLTEE